MNKNVNRPSKWILCKFYIFICCWLKEWIMQCFLVFVSGVFIDFCSVTFKNILEVALSYWVIPESICISAVMLRNTLDPQLYL